jgi:Ca-activated chloride channel homolog
MTTDERETRLTAYALNDPGLSAADRHEVEAIVAADPDARRAVAETRRLAEVLTAGLAAEQAALPVEPVVTIPSPQPVPRTAAGWTKYVVAAAVLVAVGGGTYLGWAKWKGNRAENPNQMEAKAAPVTGADETRNYEPPTFDFSRGGKGDGEKREPSREGIAGGDRKVLDATATPDKPTGGALPSPDPAALPVVPPPPAATTAPRGPASGLGGGMPGRSELAPKRAFSGPGAGGGAGGYGPGSAGPGGSPPGDTTPRGDSGGKPTDGRPKPDEPTKDGPVPGGPFGGAGLRPGTPRPAEVAKPAAPLPPADLPPPGLPPGTPDVDKQRNAQDDEKAKAGEGGRSTSDRHLQLIENPFIKVDRLDALSTFGVDVDTASYSIVRKYLTDGQLPPGDAVRLEEMVNYFPYADKPPAGDDPFAVSVEMAECPWQPAHRLVRLGLKAKVIDRDKRPPSNLVFLIDVSGSMDAPNRLPLVKESLKLLVGQLGEKDRIAIVVYAGNTGLVLDSTPADKKETIFNALDRLSAGGSTNGSGGIQQAYEVSAQHFIKNGTNRVILCTDGDWNVGTTSTDALVKLIQEKKDTGVFLSAFGFGMGNLRDEMLVQLADKGNGQYGYIDTVREANKLFVEQLSGTLVTVAKDVKVQVEFNPAVIKSYRLLGYEKRALAAKDFHDDTKDAGEMGAGHVVTALYELVPVGAPDPVVGKVDPLRYQKDPVKPAVKPEKPDEAFVVKMRHKKPDADTSTLRELPVKDTMVNYEKASDDFQFAAAVASFAMLLRDSQYKGQSNYGLVLELAEVGKKHDPGGYRAEFIEMVRKAKTLAGK